MYANAQIEIIRSEVEAAADAMISAASIGLRLVGEAREGDAKALDLLEATFCAILEACAFQDLTGQRLNRLLSLASELGRGPTTDGGLLHGPQDPGQGVDQAAADRLMGSAGHN